MLSNKGRHILFYLYRKKNGMESFVFGTSNRTEGDQIKDDKLAREHGMALWWGCLKESDRLDDLDMEGDRYY
jgi:hypothetical protein